MTTAPKAPPFRRSLAWSAGAHGVLMGLALLLPRLDWRTTPPFEIEITDPWLGDGPAKLGAPKPFVPGVPSRVNVPAEKPVPKAPESPKPAEAPKDWTLPGPKSKVETPEPPAPTPGGEVGGTGTAPIPGGSGEGSDTGVPGGTGSGGTRLSALPKLLNADEVLANLRRFYPEGERRAGREADVLLVLHIDASGSVWQTDVRTGAGTAFDEAAKKVAALMRFSPAKGLSGQPVAVKLPQPIQFRLTD